MERQSPVRRGSLVGPLILIALGLIFLLNNLGLLGWSVWQVIFRLWPVLLIAVGLDLLLRSRGGGVWTTVGSIVIVALVLGIAGVVALMPVPQAVFGERAFVNQPWSEQLSLASGSVHTEQIRQPLEGATRAEVEVNFGVGSMKLAAMSEADGLIEGSVVLQDSERISQDFRVSGGTAYYRLYNEVTSPFHGDGPYRGDDREWDLKLNPQVPMRLKLSSGVGNAELDLSKLQVTDLEVQTGVSKTDLVLPRQGQLRARIEGGISKVTVLIPRGMAARIQVEKGLASVDVNGSYQRQGNSYVSPGYETAKDRVDLMIQGGIGKISVQETETR